MKSLTVDSSEFLQNNTSITVGETFSEILGTDYRLLLLLNKNHHQVYHQISVSSSYSYICSVYASIWKWVSIVNVYTYMYILRDRAGQASRDAPLLQENLIESPLGHVATRGKYVPLPLSKVNRSGYNRRASMNAGPWPIGQYHSNVYQKQSIGHL